MKKIVLYIDSMRRGGAQRVMFNLSNFFVGVGIEVILVNEVPSCKDDSEYNIDKNIKRYFLDSCNYGNFLEKQIYRIKRLREIIKDEKPEIVLSFLGPTNIRMLISTIGINVKKVVSVRNDPKIEYGIGLKKAIAQFIFKLSDGCVFQTKEASLYFDKKIQNKSEIIFNPVDERFYNVDRSVIYKEIISVGRLQKQKNPELLLDAFIKMHKEERFKDYKLIYYGDGELKKELERKCAQNCLTDNVVFAGMVNNVAEKLKTASIFVMASDYEGMPNALMEAMAAGVPVISTDCPCGGPRSLIEDSTQGILVSCGDSSALASKIIFLLDNEDVRCKMQVNERKRAKDFSPNVIYKRWKDFLEEIIES